jgi:hypothetical protein
MEIPRRLSTGADVALLRSFAITEEMTTGTPTPT